MCHVVTLEITPTAEKVENCNQSSARTSLLGKRRQGEVKKVAAYLSINECGLFGLVVLYLKPSFPIESSVITRANVGSNSNPTKTLRVGKTDQPTSKNTVVQR